jgi:transcriptional regulator GlxA family with amidase domain
MNRKRVGIVIFDEVEILDFCGPFEVFSVTRLNEERRREEPSPFEIALISQFDRTVTTTGGMKVVPDFTFDNCPALDILVVPGGWGTRKEMHNKVMLSFVRSRAPRVEKLASVCTGALILGNAGLLDGLRATTHWRSLQMMQELFPNVIVDSKSHVVKTGKISTSAGISAGIDMALHVVADYFGQEIARATARHMEYPFPETNERRVAQPHLDSQLANEAMDVTRKAFASRRAGRRAES